MAFPSWYFSLQDSYAHVGGPHKLAPNVFGWAAEQAINQAYSAAHYAAERAVSAVE